MNSSSEMFKSLRLMLRSSSTTGLSLHPSIRGHHLVFQTRTIATRLSSENDEEIAKARSWFSQFNRNTIPKNIAQIRYDRASGAGGQHVNTY